MAWISLGKVTVPTPGTPVQVTANLPTTPPATGVNLTRNQASCLSILIQADPANTGKIYIGTVGFNKTTGVGRLAVLGKPTDNFIPSASATIPNAPSALTAADYGLDAEIANDGATVSILR